MDLKSKILIGVFFLAVAASIALTYDRIMVRNDFEAVMEEELDTPIDEAPTETVPES